MPESTTHPRQRRAVSTGRLGALLFGALLAATALPAAANVTISVLAASNAGGNGKTADNTGNETPPGGAIHGVAWATRDNSIALVANGGAGACEFFGPGCAYELPQNRAAGEILGDIGRLRASVLASTDASALVGSGVAGVTLGLIDVIQTTALGDLRFNLHFDFDNIVSGIESTLDENIIQLSFLLQPLVAGADPMTFEFTLPEFQGGHTEIDRSFAFAALPAATQVYMKIDLLIENECGINLLEPGGGACTILTDAGHTTYLGVEGNYVSLSGYSYPGFAATAPVPEPETAALLAAGLFAIGALRRRARQR